jgi:hypothetical protein
MRGDGWVQERVHADLIPLRRSQLGVGPIRRKKDLVCSGALGPSRGQMSAWTEKSLNAGQTIVCPAVDIFRFFSTRLARGP